MLTPLRLTLGIASVVALSLFAACQQTAARAHDRAWFLRMGEAYDPVAPDVTAYTLERSPVGEKLFRTAAGSFDESDLTDGAFSEFADARTLKEFNSRFVGRDRDRALPGDLLFFHQPW